MNAFHLHGRVLPGTEAQDVWVADGRFTFDEQPDAETLLTDGWLIPGLVDAHAHLSLASPSEGSPQERATASAMQQLEAGVLLIREPGSPDDGAAGLGPDKGTPRVIRAGRFIVTEGGYIPGMGLETTSADLAETAAAQAKPGEWVKLVIDFFVDGRIQQTWSRADIGTAVRAAHSAGAKVTVHATRPEVIADAVEAGVDGIEHGTGIDRDLLPVLRDKGVMWTPTLLISDGARGMVAQHASPEGAKEVIAWLDTVDQRVAAAAELGVVILAGTDAGMGPHGQIGQELRLLQQAGLSNEQVLAAGSWGARKRLGFPGIEEGAPADLLAFDSDPRADLDVLNRPVVKLLAGQRL